MYVICVYDVNEKRCSKVMKVLRKYLFHIQNSVFEGELTPAKYKILQKELDQTPVNFLNSIKINMAIKYLEGSNYSISTISRLVGFNSENHFRKVFRSVTDTTPSKFKKKS